MTVLLVCAIAVYVRCCGLGYGLEGLDTDAVVGDLELGNLAALGAAAPQ